MRTRADGSVGCSQYGGAGRGVGSMANFDRLSLQVLQSARVRRIALWSAPLWCFHLWRTAPGQEALDCFFDWLVDEERRVVVVAFFGFLPLLTLNSLSAGLAAAVYDSEADDPPAANAPWKGRHRYFLRQLEGPWMLSTMAASLLLPNGDRYKTFLWVQVDKARVGVVVLLNAAIPLVMLAFGYLAVEGGCWLADSTGSLAMSLAARYRRGSEAFPSLAAAAAAPVIVLAWAAVFLPRRFTFSLERAYNRVFRRPEEVMVARLVGADLVLVLTQQLVHAHFSKDADYWSITRYALAAIDRLSFPNRMLPIVASWIIKVGYQAAVTLLSLFLAMSYCHNMTQIVGADVDGKPNRLTGRTVRTPPVEFTFGAARNENFPAVALGWPLPIWPYAAPTGRKQRGMVELSERGSRALSLFLPHVVALALVILVEAHTKIGRTRPAVGVSALLGMTVSPFAFFPGVRPGAPGERASQQRRAEWQRWCDSTAGLEGVISASFVARLFPPVAALVALRGSLVGWAMPYAAAYGGLAFLMKGRVERFLPLVRNLEAALRRRPGRSHPTAEEVWTERARAARITFGTLLGPPLQFVILAPTASDRLGERAARRLEAAAAVAATYIYRDGSAESVAVGTNQALFNMRARKVATAIGAVLRFLLRFLVIQLTFEVLYIGFANLHITVTCFANSAAMYSTPLVSATAAAAAAAAAADEQNMDLKLKKWHEMIHDSAPTWNLASFLNWFHPILLPLVIKCLPISVVRRGVSSLGPYQKALLFQSPSIQQRFVEVGVRCGLFCSIPLLAFAAHSAAASGKKQDAAAEAALPFGFFDGIPHRAGFIYALQIGVLVFSASLGQISTWARYDVEFCVRFVTCFWTIFVFVLNFKQSGARRLN